MDLYKYDGVCENLNENIIIIVVLDNDIDNV